jgi:hypothetical protein
MLRLTAVFSLLLFATFSKADPTPQKGMSEIQQLIEKLGSQDFTEREAATKRLEELGATTLDALRAACKSQDPETARRAQEIVRKVEGKLANEKLLAPTMVELDVQDILLDTVLAELSKQAKCEVVLGGLKPEELANLKVTISTGGKVSFWTAVLKVCEVADLQVAVVGGFVAPGAMPYIGRPKGSLRVTRNTNQAVVLEARDPNTPRRSAGVYGAVLVEAVPYPKNTTVGESPTALLQAWPEPRLQWQATTSAKVTKATDATGARLAAEFATPSRTDTVATGREGIVLIRNADGSVTVVREGSSGFQPANQFAPNTHQAIIRFKRGDKLPETVARLDVSLFSSVRSGIEPISLARGLVANRTSKGVGGLDVEMTAIYQTDPSGKLVADVTLSYDPKTVHPVGVADELPGVKGTTNIGYGNHTVYGLSVTDKNGRPYGLGLRSGSNQIDGIRNRMVMKATLELVPDRNGTDPPETITFWGTHAQPIEVPVTLKDVPLSMGK